MWKNVIATKQTLDRISRRIFGINLFEITRYPRTTWATASKFKLSGSRYNSEVRICQINPTVSNNWNIIRLKNATIPYQFRTLPHLIYMPRSSKLAVFHYIFQVNWTTIYTMKVTHDFVPYISWKLNHHWRHRFCLCLPHLYSINQFFNIDEVILWVK